MDPSSLPPLSKNSFHVSPCSTAPLWVVLPSFSGIDSKQQLLSSYKLLALHRRNQLQVQTLLVGVQVHGGEAERPESGAELAAAAICVGALKRRLPLPAAFFR